MPIRSMAAYLAAGTNHSTFAAMGGAIRRVRVTPHGLPPMAPDDPNHFDVAPEAKAAIDRVSAAEEKRARKRAERLRAAAPRILHK